MLLVVSRLGKQNLILRYNWLQDYNPKIDWETGEVQMSQYSIWYEGGCAVYQE